MAPRNARNSSSGIATSSSSSSHTWPETLATLRSIRPMIAWAVTLLPEPDSPTIASVFPRWTENETPSTAWTMPSSLGKRTTRSVTERYASLFRPMPSLMRA